jgi:hypothetical protein
MKVRIETSLALFAGLKRLSTGALGSLAKASSVGANTVNGPALCSVSASPAALMAATNVLNCPAPAAIWTMFFSCLSPAWADPTKKRLAASERAVRMLNFFMY